MRNPRAFSTGRTVSVIERQETAAGCSAPSNVKPVQSLIPNCVTMIFSTEGIRGLIFRMWDILVGCRR